MKRRTGRQCALRLLLPAVVGTVLVPDAGWAEGDPKRGKREFLRCATCHAAEPNVHKEGPSLATVHGRAAASVEGFWRYSEALRRADVVWTDDTPGRVAARPEGSGSGQHDDHTRHRGRTGASRSDRLSQGAGRSESGRRRHPGGNKEPDPVTASQLTGDGSEAVRHDA